MKKQTRQLLMAVALGSLFWYYIRTGRMPPRPEELTASEGEVLPTDSMLPGTLFPATQGIVKEGQGLSCIGCVF